MGDAAILFETTRCLCLASRRAARSITRRFDAALRPHGLYSTQFSLLAALQLAGPQSINALADLLGAERTTISRNLARVQQQRLVRIDVDPDDARARVASVTVYGRRALDRAFATWRKTQAELVAEVGADAAASLCQLAGGPCVLELPTRSTAPVA